MTLRGRRLFDSYVTNHLNHQALASLPIDSHIFNLTTSAAEAHIPMPELFEEVGPIKAALVAARGGKR